MAEEAGQIEIEDEGAPRDPEDDARRRFALAQIRQYPDAALRLPAREVEQVDDDVRRLAERMISLMHDAHGVGLAATQVGVLRRLFVFHTHDDAEARAVVNPQLVELSKEQQTDDEGCLSLQGVLVPVERSVRVTVRGLDLDGKDVSYELEGLPARVAQHESDHLDGVLIIDRTDRESRKQAMAVLRPQPILVGR
ncbi:MAG TPA: peptide deformylase [Gaiellaceae bacterium]|nr:peptide deformylase [Gaiellaceae bacterium]